LHRRDDEGGCNVPYYSLDDEGFWAIGPESLDWMRVVAEAIDVQFARFPLGDPDDENTPFASVLCMPPNYELWRHKHDCHRFEAIIKGSIRVGDRTLGPGDFMTSAPNEPYGPYYAGPEGCVTVEIFSTRKGLSTIIDDDTDPRAVGFLRGLMDDPDPIRRDAARIAFADSGLDLDTEAEGAHRG
jgi:hypothetical protein